MSVRIGWLRTALCYLRGLSACTVVVILATAAAAQSHQEIVAKDVARVYVTGGSGEVIVEGWDKETLRVQWLGDPPEISAADKEITVSTRSEDIKLLLPRSLQLLVSTTSGDIQIQGMMRRIASKSFSGSFRAERCAGPLKIKTTSGDIFVLGHNGDLSVQTVSGGVTAKKTTALLLEVKTVSGEIFFQGEKTRRLRLDSHSGDIVFRGMIEPEGDAEFTTFSGDVDIDLPAVAHFDLEAGSRSGEISTQRTLSAARKSQKKMSARIGKGGPQIRIQSFSGDIEIN